MVVMGRWLGVRVVLGMLHRRILIGRLLGSWRCLIIGLRLLLVRFMVLIVLLILLFRLRLDVVDLILDRYNLQLNL